MKGRAWVCDEAWTDLGRVLAAPTRGRVACGHARGGLSGSSPWSNSRLDLVQVLAPVVGPHRVERAGLIQAREHLIRQRRHELVGFLRDAHRQLGQSAWRNRVDQRTRGVVDPVHVLGVVFGRRERLAALQLAGQVERTAVPERDVAEHAGHAPVLVDHGAELLVAQTRHDRPHPSELACVRRHEGAIHDDQTNYLDGGVGLGGTGTVGGRAFIESMWLRTYSAYVAPARLVLFGVPLCEETRSSVTRRDHVATLPVATRQIQTKPGAMGAGLLSAVNEGGPLEFWVHVESNSRPAVNTCALPLPITS